MKRFIATFAACALLCGAAFSLAEPVTASAEEEKSATRLTAENTELFLPAGYEQYLPLVKPSHAAVSDRYTAVADGALLYVYDRDAGVYSVYEHKTGETQEATVVSELQFTKDGRLYFTDERTMLYAYDFSARTATSTGIPCATFLIADDYLYYATATATNQVSFYYVSLSKIDYDSANPIKRDGDEFYGKNPHLAYENGVLHCMFNNTRLVCDAASKTFTGTTKPLDNSVSILEQINGLHYVCAYNGALYYTVKDAGAGDGLYRTDDDGNAVRLLEAKGLSTLTVSNGKLYCIKDSSVLEIAVSESSASFTGYEITSASSSENRLNGASDSVRAGDLLVTADTGNDRISVYNFKTEQYTVVPCPNVALVATDGALVAATDGSTITVFSYDNVAAQSRYPIDEIMGEVKGVICLFSEIYYVTANGAYGKIGGTPVYYSSYGNPAGMTCDLYGTIYVSYRSGTVSAFREEDFSERGSGIELDVRLPANHTSLRADFKGNLYCLADGTLYQNGVPFAEKAQNAAFVYGDESQAASVALGFEDPAVYLAYGNYFVKTKESTLDVPTLSAIPLENAKETIFTPHDENDLLVKIEDKSVGILIDLPVLEASEAYFPYAGYSRKAETTGVLLAAVGGYSLVAIEEDGNLSAMLFRTESCTPLEKDTYYANADKNAYLTNNVTACYVPCMEESLANAKLTRGERVRVTGIINAPDRDYALVSFEENGENRGYLPLSYLTDVSPLTTESEEYKLGYLKAGAEAHFVADDGTEMEPGGRRLVRVYHNGDGTYTVKTEENGITYSARVEKSALESGRNNALRYSLIVGLSVVAVLIVGVYVYLLPVRKR